LNDICEYRYLKIIKYRIPAKYTYTNKTCDILYIIYEYIVYPEELWIRKA